jgi:acyl-CoA synthetase (AMP-forming)/AMP-acid ligase II
VPEAAASEREAALGERLKAVLDFQPDAPFLHFQGETHTFGTIARVGETLEQILAASAVDSGLAIGVVARNRSPQIAAILGIVVHGRCLLSLPGLAPDGVLAAVIERERPAVVIAQHADWSREGVLEAARAAGAVGIALPDQLPGLPELIPELSRIGEGSHCLAPEGAAAGLQTSGTTGPPKRVFLEGARLLHSVTAVQAHHGVAASGPRLRSGTAALLLPVDHMGPFGTLIQSVLEGRQIAMLERFSPAAWADLVEEHRIKTCGLPPAVMRMVLDAGIPKEKIATLRAVRAGSAPLPAETTLEWEARYAIPVLQAYGATEFAGGIASSTIEHRRRWGAAKLTSVGRPHPGVKLRVVDPNGEVELPVGQTGLLLIRRGAPGDPPGWVRTNDLAHLDGDGFLYIDGRADGVINRGGLKVDAHEVEGLLRLHPAVAEVAVVGLPDRRMGQVPVAAVVVSPGRPAPSEAQLRGWLRGRLEAYKVPARIRFFTELPTTNSGKIATAELTSLFD